MEQMVGAGPDLGIWDILRLSVAVTWRCPQGRRSAHVRTLCPVVIKGLIPEHALGVLLQTESQFAQHETGEDSSQGPPAVLRSLVLCA